MQKEQAAVFSEWQNTLQSSAPRTRPVAAEPLAQPRSWNTEPQPSRDLITAGTSPEPAPTSVQPVTDDLPTFAEPTEVLLYGFVPSMQASAIAFFENASGGRIYEDYDRAAANPRFAQSSILSQTNERRAAAAHPAIGSGAGGLTQAALRKINEYKGGDHWIKVTFDSPAAAERAIQASSHILGGCTVHAELWHGQGPRDDVAIIAKDRKSAGTVGRQQPQRGARAKRGEFASLPTRTPGTYSFNPADSISSTETAGASSNTINASSNTLDASTSSATLTADGQNDAQLRQRQPPGEAQAPAPPLRKPKIKGARTIALQPKENALVPVKPLRVRVLGNIPILGSLLVGSPQAAPLGADEVKGLPMREDGSVDWKRTGWFWWSIGCLDWIAGTDICGVRGED